MLTQEEYKTKMSDLVAKFVTDVTELTREMARDSLMVALGPVEEKQVEKATNKIAKKTAKKVARKTVAKIKKKLTTASKRRKRDANRAWVLRKKQKDGAKLKAKDLKWLTKYSAKNTPMEK